MQQVMIQAAGLKLDPARCVVYRKGSIIHVGHRETLTLEVLMLAEGRVVTIRELLDHRLVERGRKRRQGAGCRAKAAQQAARAKPHPDHRPRRLLPRGMLSSVPAGEGTAVISPRFCAQAHRVLIGEIDTLLTLWACPRG
jgi:hypothetical protein